jgi:hypothetical protein
VEKETHAFEAPQGIIKTIVEKVAEKIVGKVNDPM